MSNTNAVRGLRGPKYENWPLGDPRAAAPGKYDLKSGENGHLARANGATGGPYCSPALPSVCGRQFEPLAGRGGGFGARSCTSAAVVALWALLQIEWLRLRKTRGTQAFRRCAGRRGRDTVTTPDLPGEIARGGFCVSVRTGKISTFSSLAQ